MRHSYAALPAEESDWALKRLSISWADGGAYALLGPSGCGKTTLLNLISGLLRPTEGQILIDGHDVTDVSPEARNIAQVFQFPVIYDTMTVYDNLAFPLRNRGMVEADVDQRVREVAEMLELETTLKERAAGLTADGKQKISLGRGLARSDVNVIMFDEPLTVIDPHLKWVLRSKLKELHQRFRVTMIYVTHDQTEALTFADQVVVMNDGVVVQTGTPVELFERPNHTFVGHFIGSPGMNVLPCEVQRRQTRFSPATRSMAYERGARPLRAARTARARRASGVRRISPRRVSPAEIVKVVDAGRHRIVEADHSGHRFKMLVPESIAIPEGGAHVRFDPAHTRIYRDGWLVT